MSLFFSSHKGSSEEEQKCIQMKFFYLKVNFENRKVLCGSPQSLGKFDIFQLFVTQEYSHFSMLQTYICH